MVPMLKEDKLIGAIAIYRQEVRPFTEKQIELVKNFAAQAVIAIENTRLLNELRKSLQQQTATSDVLKVISSSLNDLKPVFETIGQRAETAVRCRDQRHRYGRRRPDPLGFDQGLRQRKALKQSAVHSILSAATMRPSLRVRYGPAPFVMFRMCSTILFIQKRTLRA